MISLHNDPALQNRLKELNARIHKKHDNLIDECVAISDRHILYKKLHMLWHEGHNQYTKKGNEIISPAKTAESLAKEIGYSKRLFLYKKFIGDNINRYLIPLIKEKLNNLVLLYKFAHLTYTEQEILIYSPLKDIKKELKSYKVKEKKEKVNLMAETPKDKVAIYIDETIYHKAKKLLNNGLTVTQNIQHFLSMEICKKEHEEIKNNKKSDVLISSDWYV